MAADKGRVSGGGQDPFPFILQTGAWLGENGARRVQGPEGALEPRVSPSILSRVLPWEVRWP